MTPQRTLSRVLSAAGLVALCAAALLHATHVPDVVPATASAARFSAERAMEFVREVAQPGFRLPGVRNAVGRDAVQQHLMLLGLRPEVQRTTGIGTRYAVAGPVTNLLVRLPGRDSGGPAVLLMAHYDAVPASPGAGDDGSGTAVLLETVRALRFSPRLRHDVIALFTDGEESGLLGAAAFVREHPWARDVAVVLNFEGRGTSGPSLMFETGPGNLDVVRALRRVRGVRATSLSTAVYRRLPNDTDLSELAALERPALNFAFIDGVERYHTQEDDLAHLDPRSVQHHGNAALALTRFFADGELPRPRTSDAVFFDFPLVGLVVYPEWMAIVLAIIAALLTLVVARGASTRSPRWGRAMILGAGAVLVGVIVAVLAAVAVAGLLQRLHGASPNGGRPEFSDVYAAAVALLSFGLASAAYALVRRAADAAGTFAGTLIVWALLSIVVSVAMPGASFLFTWPTLAAAGAALVAQRWTLAATSVAWLGAAVVVCVILPIVYLMACIALGLETGGAAVLAILTAAATPLLSPVLERIGVTRLSAVPIGALVASALLFVLGGLTVRTSAKHPGAAALIYAVDADSGHAWLTGYAFGASSRAALLGVLRHSADSGGLRAAKDPPAWVGRPFGEKSILAAPLLPVSAPTVTLLSETAEAPGTAGRRVSLRIRPGALRRATVLSADPGLISAAAVDGKAVDRRRYRVRPARWSLEYAYPPDSGFVITLTLPAHMHGTLTVRGTGFGVPNAPDLKLPRRPEHILPFRNGDMTWVLTRVPL